MYNIYIYSSHKQFIIILNSLNVNEAETILKLFQCFISVLLHHVRRALEIKAWFQKITNRKWPMGNQMVT